MSARRRHPGTTLRSALGRVLGVVALLVTTGMSAGCGVFPQTAYCGSSDPVVTPTRAAPGDKLDVRITGGGGVDCSTDLPDHARYTIWIMSRVDGTGDDDLGTHYYSADLATLDPDEDGAARSTVAVPQDMPPGPATISVDLENAMTVCEIDPSMSCAPDPFALIEIAE
ncbi:MULTISPECIES: hypothetical protein [unclassified Isoptericola]|uniref:hypothetical protein n=1 Tax=unclassified Isoptericola TaxID=2623355 RepID=UPI003652672A